MVLPRKVALLNKRFLNRVVVHLAPRLPGLAVLHHRGRRSGRRYAIPINVFVRGERYLFALTYGPGTDWLKNVQTAGRCTITHRSEEHTSELQSRCHIVCRRLLEKNNDTTSNKSTR